MAVERELRHIGAHAADYTAGVTFDLDALKAGASDAVSPFDLFSAGPPLHCQQMLNRVDRAIAGYVDADKKPPKELLRDRDAAAKKLAIAQRAAELAMARQDAWPGCVCLGFGGRWPKEGLSFRTPDGRILADPTVTTFRDICPCPLGDDARARIEAARTALLADDRARRLDKLWRDLKMPELPDWVSLDSHPDRVKIGLVRRWWDGQFKPGLVIAGENQVGKSVTAYLLAREAILRQRGCIAMTVPDLLDRLRETFNHDQRLKSDPEQPVQVTHQTLIKSLQEVQFLLLDDLGAEKMTEYVETALWQILNGRADNARDPHDGRIKLWTVITTNLRKEALLGHYGPRIYSRISHLCDRVVFEGDALGPAERGLQDLEDLAEGT
jgi:hypothetical protein